MNQDYYNRLMRVIPGGCHTYSKGYDQFPENAPELLVRGDGAYVWDSEDNKYLDYGMGLRSVILGYCNDFVLDSVRSVLDLGNNLTRSSMLELTAAEAFVDYFPNADMVKFAKNGSNVTTAAIKLARAFTGRDLVCVPEEQPFFSFDDWFIGTTEMARGTDPDSSAKVLKFAFKDSGSLERLFEKYPNRIAAVIMEPSTNVTPCPAVCSELSSDDGSCKTCPDRASNILLVARKLCDQNGALLVFDEMITGFRWSSKGAQDFFGVIPDLTTMGKGLANGFPLASVSGRREIMELGSTHKKGMERTFLLSSTHGSEMIGLAAMLGVLNFFIDDPKVGRQLWHHGGELKRIANKSFHRAGLSDLVEIDGPGIAPLLVCKDRDGKDSPKLKTLVMQALLEKGVLMPWIAPSFAHGAEELQILEEGFDYAASVCARALEYGLDSYLVGPSVKPVFRQYN